MIQENLLALQVVVPLVAAPFCLLLRNGSLAWLVALVGSWAALAISIALLFQVREVGYFSYDMGAWAPPWGIEYRVDIANAFVLVIVAALGAIILPYAKRSVATELSPSQQSPFYTSFMLCLSGLLGVAITGDAFNLFVFLEISSLSSYVLIAMGHDRRALTASFQYLILGTIGATFIVIGIGLMYMATGTLNMADLAVRLDAVGNNRTVVVAFGFIAIGASLKLALFPLHYWLPNAYAYAPSAVTAFLAATATKVSIYILLRFLFSIFGLDTAADFLHIDRLLFPLSIIGIVVASTVAIFQSDSKRLLAYSSVAQVGYMVLGISFLSVTGLSAAIVHLFNHAVTKGGLFLLLGCVFLRVGSVKIDDMAGLAKRMPYTCMGLVIGGLSLIGVPLTAGFVSKWVLVRAALDEGYWIIALIVLGASVLAVIYVWRIVEAVYLRSAPPETPGQEITEAPASMLIPAWFLIATSIYFGIDTSLTLSVAEEAARQLLGVAP